MRLLLLPFMAPRLMVWLALSLIWAAATSTYAQDQDTCEQAQLSKLQILHSSDNESSFQDPNTLEPKILNYAAAHAGLRALAEQECIPSLHVTAGDHTIPGPFYQAAAEIPEFGAPGLADIAIYNAMQLQANGMGNHEFDGGINDFARLVNAANYPFIAVNLDFSAVVLEMDTPPIQVGADAEDCALHAGKVVKSCFVTLGTQRVGLIGRVPADFFNVIADPETNLPGLDFVGGRDPMSNQPLVSAVGQVLEQVAALEAQGINRIVLIDHAQDFTGDPLSATALRGIDIIIAAGSTGFMAQPMPNGPFNLLREGDTPQASYPTVRLDSENNLLLVVNSDQLYRYIGNLIVTFNDEGNISDIDIRSGPVATIEAALTELGNVLGTPITVPAEVESVFTALQNTPTIQSSFEVIGMTTSTLNGLRTDVRSRETNLGRLAADSTIWFAQQTFPEITVDVALKNGGGIRDTILGPNVTRLTVQAALAFDNQLAVLQLTGSQLLAAMENAVSRVPALDGRFPQIASMVLEYDASLPGVEGQAELTMPSRIQNLTITRADGTADVLVSEFQAQGDLSRTFVMATNDFLSTGGDGYAALAAAIKLETTMLGEQEILVQYIQQELGGTVDLPEPLADPRVIRIDMP